MNALRSLCAFALMAAGAVSFADEASLKACREIIEKNAQGPTDVTQIFEFGHQCREALANKESPDSVEFVKAVRKDGLAEHVLEYIDRYSQRMMTEEKDSARFQWIATERMKLYRSVEDLFTEVTRPSHRPPGSMPAARQLPAPTEAETDALRKAFDLLLTKLNSADEGEFIEGVAGVMPLNGLTDAEKADSLKRAAADRALVIPYKDFIASYLEDAKYSAYKSSRYIYVQRDVDVGSGINEMIFQVDPDGKMRLSSASSSKTAIKAK